MKKLFRTLLVGLFLALFWPYFLYKKYGNLNYSPEGKTIIVCNHYSTFDAFFIYLIFRKVRIRFVTINDVKNKYLSRFVTWLFDCLYIDSNVFNIRFYKQCLNILNNDGIICIFPEGVINPRKYGFFDFKNSFMYFAKKTGAKILPLYIFPELKPFKYSKIFIGNIVERKDYMQYKTLDEAGFYVQSKIMEYSNSFD